MDLIIPSVCGTTTSTIENDYFVEATKYIYGLNIVGSTATDEDKRKANQMWASFLAREGKTQSQFLAEVGTDPTNRSDTQVQALQRYVDSYNDFLIDQLHYVSMSEKATLSVTEGTKIIWSIFEIIILLMKKINQTQVADSKAIQLMTQLQREYQNALQKTFFYTGAEPSLDASSCLVISIPTSNNPDNYNLGYGNITMGDVIQYLFSSAKANPGIPQSFITTGINYLDVQYNATDDTYTSHAAFNNHQIVIPSETKTALEAIDSFKQRFQQYMDAFQAQGGTGFSIKIPWGTVGGSSDSLPSRGIRYTYSGGDDKEKTYYSLAVQTRAQYNRQMQTAIDAIKTKQETIADRSQQIQRLIDSSTSAQNKATSLLASTITQLKTILSAIYK